MDVLADAIEMERASAERTVDGRDFEPVAIERDRPAPTARVHPDRSLGWIRRMLPIVLDNRVTYFGTLALASLAMLLQVALPAVIRSAIDQALTERSVGLNRFVVAVLVIGLVRAALTLVYRFLLYRGAFQIDTDLRILLYDHLTTLSFGFYDRTQSGQVISRANSDIRSVQMFLTFAPLISMTTLTFTLAIGFMLSVNVPLTLVAIAPLPGVYWMGVRLRNQVFPLSWIVQARLAEVATTVDENINGVRVVRSFGAEERQVNELADAATRVRWANIKTAEAQAKHNPVIENLPRVGMGLVLVYGGWLVIQGDVTEGTLFAFTAYVTMLQAPFRMLGMFLMLGQRAKASAERIFELLDEVPDVVDRPDAGHLRSVRGEIEFDDVTFGYHSADAATESESESDSETRPEAESESDFDEPNRVVAEPVLRHCSFRIEPGETVALVGRTGSGKSTVARLLSRYYDVDEGGGAVRVDGHDVRDLTQVSLRANIGMVADDPFLFSVSLADNIAYGRPGASRDDVVLAAKAAQAHDFISALPDGYDTVVGERGYTLSGGQRQRIAIARALLVNPKILVLDDATSAIDVLVEERIHAALDERLAERTTIVIAHRLSTIALADRVLLLEDGRVVASGPHRELMDTEPRYAAVLAHLDDGVEDPLDDDQHGVDA